MLLSDKEIREQIKITPFEENKKRPGVISYGLSSYGYDFRIGRKFKIFSNVHTAFIDPKKFSTKCFEEIESDCCIIPPNSFVLGESVERVEMPPDVLAICVGKSTYARCGIIVNVTPLEPAWVGKITIEISNTTPLPAVIYADEGIMQVIFLKGQRCEVNYASKNGKYQNQLGITLPIVD
jgi:dCTP deaminase